MSEDAHCTAAATEAPAAERGAEAAPETAEAEVPTEQQISNAVYLQEKITQAVELARGAVEELVNKVGEYDGVHGAAEKAGEYLHTTLDTARAAVSELGNTAQTLKGTGEIPVKAFSSTIAKASSAITALVDAAKEYDEKHHLSTRLGDAIAGPKEQALAAIAAVASYVTAAANTANAQLQGVTAAVVSKLRDAATGALERAIPAAARADEKLHVTEKGAQATAAVVRRIHQLDEHFGLSSYLAPVGEKAVNLDQKVTGGKVVPALSSAFHRGLAMAGNVRSQWEEKKRELHAEDTSK